ncbi:MAG TPA: von Willebrand factor type A domain-containing protein [Polyangia bacterium]
MMKSKTGRCCQRALTLFSLLAALGAGCGMGGSSDSPSGNGTSYGSGGAHSSGTPYGPAYGSGGSAATNAGSGSGGAVGAAGVAATGGATNTGDKYVPVGTNPFIATAHDPLSTFGADVDTASYDIFRRDVNAGTLPIPDSVRLEDYVNDFAYDYPAPAVGDPVPFQISLAAARNVFDRQTTLLRVGIQAVKPPPFEKRPANVVFLIDVSGSMQAPNKLPLVQRIAVDALSVLDPTDRVSIVTYASGTAVRLPPTPVTQRDAIVNVVNGLVAGGSTNGGGGLNLAYDQAAAGYIDGGINHVILCTDGDFNVGPSSTAELLALVRSKRATGVTLTALGFGSGNLNDQMMEAVSNAGNGMYNVISSADQADNYAQNRLLSTLIHVAKDMKIQVEFNPAKVAAYRLLGYEDRAIADMSFRDDAVDGGEVGAGHRVTALYELVPAGQLLALKAGQPAIQDGAVSTAIPEVAASDMVMVKVRWKGLDATDATSASEVSASLAPEHCSNGIGVADPDLRWAAGIAAFAEILKKSPFADPTFLPEIDAVVAAQAARDGDRTEFAQLYGVARPLLAR